MSILCERSLPAGRNGTKSLLTLPANSRVWWILIAFALFITGCSSGSSIESINKGKDLAYSRCTACHEAAIFEKHSYSRSEWKSVISRMMGHGAQFTEEEQSLIADFLSSEYGP